jgi:hypothetical protein
MCTFGHENMYQVDRTLVRALVAVIARTIGRLASCHELREFGEETTQIASPNWGMGGTPPEFDVRAKPPSSALFILVTLRASFLLYCAMLYQRLYSNDAVRRPTLI